MMEYRDQMFQSVLSDYPIDVIRAAFLTFVKRNKALPTPSCIVGIIEPPEPIPDMAIYVGIRNKVKVGIFVSQREHEYLRWCEERAIQKPLEWKQTISDIEQRLNHGNF